MTLQAIELKYVFQFPLLYKQLDVDGMLNVGEYGPKWYAEVYPILKQNPPLLLNSNEFELLNIKAVDEAIEDIRNPEDYRGVKEELILIPFGQSGAGDYYCFFLNEENNGDIPIVFVWHDSDEATYMAKNLQDFIFRMLLTDMSDQDIYNEVPDDEFRNNIESVFKSHKKYLTSQQENILQEILNRDIIDYKTELSNEPARGLLTDVELLRLLNEIISFDKMNTSFNYSKY